MTTGFPSRKAPADRRGPKRPAFSAALNCTPAPWTPLAVRPFVRRDPPGHKIEFNAKGSVVIGVLLFCLQASAQTTTNSLSLSAPMPDVGMSLLRVLGALALVLALFLGGVWLFRNWQRLNLQRGRTPKLSVLEVRSLGGRHALYVVGYEQERFLVAASPTGVNLLSHLQPAEAGTADPAHPVPPATFVQALTEKLKGK